MVNILESLNETIDTLFALRTEMIKRKFRMNTSLQHGTQKIRTDAEQTRLALEGVVRGEGTSIVTSAQEASRPSTAAHERAVDRPSATADRQQDIKSYYTISIFARRNLFRPSLESSSYIVVWPSESERGSQQIAQHGRLKAALRSAFEHRTLYITPNPGQTLDCASASIVTE